MTRRAGREPEEEIGKPDARCAAGASEPGAHHGRRLLTAISLPKPIREMTPEERRDFAEKVGDLMAARMAADVTGTIPREPDELR
ncbi:MAG: hypothetical protein ACLQBX_16115 [Candidatus Limnocylindrales bacterium]